MNAKNTAKKETSSGVVLPANEAQEQAKANMLAEDLRRVSIAVADVADGLAVLDSVVALLSMIGDSQSVADPEGLAYVFGLIHTRIHDVREELYRICDEADTKEIEST